MSIVAVAVMVAVRLMLNPLLGHRSPFLLFTPAVMFAAWYGGLWPGLLATVLGAGVGATVLGLGSTAAALEDVDRLALFLVVGAVVSGLQVKVAAAADRINALLRSEQLARAAAEAANRSKDEFLATVSHELRSPLTAIIGWASMLREHPTDPVSLCKAADVIDRNARLQQRLVEDILDTVRASRGTIRLERQRVELASLVAAAVDAARPGVEERRIEIRLAIEPGESPVWGDPARLHQVLMNLLTNATKFTPPGGTIDVHLERIEQNARITVSDTGAGIDQDLLPHVFDRFTKGRHSPQGLGLGLSIVRHLVVMHGGGVTAASAGPGKGASFTVAFPLLAAPIAPSVATLPGSLRASL